MFLTKHSDQNDAVFILERGIEPRLVFVPFDGIAVEGIPSSFRFTAPLE
jgi:hypothetical protein